MIKIIKKQTPVKTELAVDIIEQVGVDEKVSALMGELAEPIFQPAETVKQDASTFTVVDKAVLHVSQWMRHIYPANKGDIDWMFQSKAGMWFKIEVRNGFATVSYGHGNIHSENANWVKTNTWRESGAIVAERQRKQAEDKFKLEKPSAIVQQAIDEDII